MPSEDEVLQQQLESELQRKARRSVLPLPGSSPGRLQGRCVVYDGRLGSDPIPRPVPSQENFHVRGTDYDPFGASPTASRDRD